jgi:hypothetical protein
LYKIKEKACIEESEKKLEERLRAYDSKIEELNLRNS